jgi:hypothetical protein
VAQAARDARGARAQASKSKKHEAQGTRRTRPRHARHVCLCGVCAWVCAWVCVFVCVRHKAQARHRHKAKVQGRGQRHKAQGTITGTRHRHSQQQASANVLPLGGSNCGLSPPCLEWWLPLPSAQCVPCIPLAAVLQILSYSFRIVVSAPMIGEWGESAYPPYEYKNTFALRSDQPPPPNPTVDTAVPGSSYPPRARKNH